MGIDSVTAKKNLWILNHYAHMPGECGGTRHYDLAKGLADEYNVTIFASAFDHRTKKSRISEDSEYCICNVDGINFVLIETMPYKSASKRFLNMIDFSIKMYRTAKNFEPPDVILASSVHLFTCLAGYFLAKKYKVKWIFEVRDLWPQTLLDMGLISSRHPVAWLFRKIERFLYAKSHRIVVLLPYASEYIEGLGIDKNKIVYIPNGVNTESEKITDSSKYACVYDIINKHRDKFIAMYVGSHGHANALDVIIKTAHLVQERGVDDIHFLMVGDGPVKNELMDFCNREKINNVFFYQSVPKDCVRKLLSYADITLVAMLDLGVYKYGISLNKLFDYLFSGKPIVFSGNVRNDIVCEQQCGFSVGVNDYEAMADAVVRLYNMEPEQRKIFGDNGLKYIYEYHDTSVLANKLKEVLASLN